MYWQYIIVGLIGIVALGIAISKIYRLFVPAKKPSKGGCDGCTGCSSLNPKQ